MGKQNTYIGGMDYWHRNPPAPFNPEFNPNAAKAQTIAVKELEQEGWYDNTTLEERQNSNVLSVRYKEVLARLDNN